MTLIAHLASKNDWVQAAWTEEYRHPTLETEGYIHASSFEQVIETANRHFAGREDLVLLCVDATRLRAELRWEPAPDVGELFPHIYGPLDTAAVSQALELVPGDGGRFDALPRGLIDDGHHDSLWVRAENDDGSPHWAHPVLKAQVQDGLVVTRTGYGSVVARENGAFTSNWSTNGHYWPDRWFNVIRLERPDGTLDGFYCNIARPLPFDGRTVRYVDMQLDVRVSQGEDGELRWRLLDEDEFEVARKRYNYDAATVRRCYEAVDEIAALVQARQFPFNR